MEKYLLIESKDPFESAEVERDYELARNLASAGHQVTFFLVQNGVLPARASARSEELSSVLESGAEVLSDAFSLRERGVETLADGVRSVSIDVLMDRFCEGRKTLWL